MKCFMGTDMKLVRIITPKNDSHSFVYLFPLFRNRKLLRDIGIRVDIDHLDGKAISGADCIIFDNRIFRKWGQNLRDEKAILLLERLKTIVDRVFWLDTTDSTGTTQFHLLPYIDKYLKSYVLNDKSLYTKFHYGGRVFTDFYHFKYGIECSDNPYWFSPAQNDQLNKIECSWNASLADHGRWSAYLSILWRFIGSPLYASAKFYRSSKRNVDISSRFKTEYQQEIISFQRKSIQKLMESMGVPTERIPRYEYLKELRNCKIGVSPFGFGEFAYRDFEIVLNGAMLFKPDMSHMETWPDLYAAGETYMPFKWDFSDLESCLNVALQNNRWLEIARNAQDLYEKYLFSQEGRESFCTRFLSIIEDQDVRSD